MIEEYTSLSKLNVEHGDFVTNIFGDDLFVSGERYMTGLFKLKAKGESVNSQGAPVPSDMVDDNVVVLYGPTSNYSFVNCRHNPNEMARNYKITFRMTEDGFDVSSIKMEKIE